ncbi:uncharacterized protein LOC100903896 [Galendromus occidentalis]|uniref:Uncharacterized protein LOC100903896 n=1 Tax=Galendromus occidentalis TaxID=34638 RepID=A0AAJ6QUN5_9ACAR|nr:uncharacterized protein LOC100903896 [Galendromus occidentalis]
MNVPAVLLGLCTLLTVASAQGPPIRDEWRKAAREACGGNLEARINTSALDQETCVVDCAKADGSIARRDVPLKDGSPCHRHHMVAPPFPLLLGTCKNRYCDVKLP